MVTNKFAGVKRKKFTKYLLIIVIAVIIAYILSVCYDLEELAEKYLFDENTAEKSVYNKKTHTLSKILADLEVKVHSLQHLTINFE